MIKVKVPRWLVVAVWFGFVVPVQVAWDILKHGWALLNGDDEKPSRWEWVSVALIVVVAVGTLGSYRGWWA